MSQQPLEAYSNTECNNCGDCVYEGENFYMFKGDKLCPDCAEKMRLICPACQGVKQPNFKTCFSCYQEANGGDKWE